MFSWLPVVIFMHVLVFIMGPCRPFLPLLYPLLLTHDLHVHLLGYVLFNKCMYSILNSDRKAFYVLNISEFCLSKVLFLVCINLHCIWNYAEFYNALWISPNFSLKQTAKVVTAITAVLAHTVKFKLAAHKQNSTWSLLANAGTVAFCGTKTLLVNVQVSEY